jgi:hypothetical protein
MDLRAFIFVPALVACVLFGFLFALFLSNAYLTVLQSTGSGSRDVVWIPEPILDSFWKVFYLGWLVGLWLGPATFIGAAFAKTDIAWMRYALPLSVFWLAYPFSQLSSLSGPSIWLPIHHEVFGRMARKPHLVIGYLLLSAPVLMLFGLAIHLAFSKSGTEYLFIGAPLFVISILVYARLLGRLAFSLVYTKSILSRKKRKKKSEAAPTVPSDAVPPLEPEEAFVQPSELPPIQTPDEGDLTGYDIHFDDKPRKRVRAVSVDRPEPEKPKGRPKDEDDELESYVVHEAEVQPQDVAPPEMVKPSELEMKLLDRSQTPKPPKQVWTLQLLEFLVRPESLPIIGLLTVLCLLLGAAVRVAREFNPVRGAAD